MLSDCSYKDCSCFSCLEVTNVHIIIVMGQYFTKESINSFKPYKFFLFSNCFYVAKGDNNFLISCS